jgi:hypothetical protein
MFEDFKEKIRQKQQQEQTQSTGYSPQILEKLQQSGIDPDNITLKQLFPATLDESGNDLSLMSGAEMEIMVTYAKTRKILLEKYPQSQEEVQILGQSWDEEPGELYRINIEKARQDPLSKVFLKILNQLKEIYDKIDVLQHQASEFEKICLRFYWHLTFNWNHVPINSFREILPDSDIFEVVEAYFKICRKYRVPTFEEPYYFLSEHRRCEIKLEGDLLKRSTEYSDNEIQVSILEAFA